MARASPEHGASKAEWRDWARATRRRLARDAAARAAADDRMRAHLGAWGAWRDARWALVYLPFGDECDPLAGAADEHGPRLATTRTGAGTGPLSVHVLDASALERHAFGFSQPRPDAPGVTLAEIDVVLVPGLAFDQHGGRLGYGRGLYDRLLGTLHASAQTVGVARRDLVVPAVPVEHHDVDVAWLLSEDGITRVRPR